MNVKPTTLGAAPLVASALARQLGVKIVMSQSATTAMIDGSTMTIYLPCLPVNLPEEIEKIIWGFIHHEAGHGRHTDFSVRIDNRVELGSDPLLDGMLRILEDIRMERAHIRLYPGANRILADLVGALVSIDFFQSLPNDASIAQAFQDFVLKYLRSSVLGQSALRDQALLSRQALQNALGAGFVTRLVAELQPIYAAESTTDALNLAFRVRQFLQEELEAKQPPPPPPSGDTSQESDPSSEGGSATTDDDSPGDPDDSGNLDVQPDDVDSSDSTGGDMSQTADQEALQQILAGGDTDKSLGDLGEALTDLLNEKIDQQPASVVEMPRDHCRQEGSRDQAAITAARVVSTRLAVQLKQQLESHNDVISDPSTRGKRISRRHLSRVAHKDYRVFVHRERFPEINTAVVSLIDVSGSMKQEGRVELASQATLATSLALGTLPFLAHAVGAFPSTQGNGSVELIKDFGDTTELVSSRFKLHPRGGTPLAEALLWAANRLLQRSEERRIIFVATDGDPNDVLSAKEILVHLHRLGFEAHCLGIRCNDKHGIFDSFVTVDEVRELPQAFIALFERVLRRSA